MDMAGMILPHKVYRELLQFLSSVICWLMIFFVAQCLHPLDHGFPSQTA